MKTSDGDTKGKGRIRSLSRKGTRTGKSATVAAGKPTRGGYGLRTLRRRLLAPDVAA